MESNLNVEVGAFRLQGDFTRLRPWQRITTSPTVRAQSHTRSSREKERGKGGDLREEGDWQSKI